MVVLRIKNWDANFENNRSREIKDLDWVRMPNKQDGDGYTELVDHPDGAAHFGAWCAIVEVASKCHPRGTLLRDNGTPYDSRSLARVSRLRPEVFDAAIPRLLEIGWLETHDLGDPQVTTEPTKKTPMPQEGAVKPQAGAGPTERDETEDERGDENDDERRKCVVAVLLGEGFKADDPLLHDPSCTPEQVQIAIANANAYPEGRLTDRRGYIAQAIRKGYKPSAKVKRAMDARTRKEAEVKRQNKSIREAEDLESQARQAADAILALPDSTFGEMVSRVFDENPNLRKFVKVDRNSPWIQLKVFELMRKEEAHASACN